LDTETTGFPRHGSTNEPVQIAAILFKNGQENKTYCRYFMPEAKITKSAKDTHGLSKEKLEEKGATSFTKGESERLMNFLNEHKEWPIVAHYAKYDREDVLRPAFEKAGTRKIFPSDGRWRCTFEMAGKSKDLVPDDLPRGLDDLLEHFGYERRCEDDKHDALTDCRCAAKTYMKLAESRLSEGGSSLQ